ncbi:hypothetical protein GCM10011351_00880 [Paraliobacillus quinghaiensis]|uniref:Uncharacterized protein n=1 Tax=Paraliobacillus quinghaiensis TaxID=470815 RepID=A0A917TD21_9BACI|nr:hypothetical protein [Paraliobacillus quinghaiensis]GGM18938.1 hypothetical protein GCM10011351_00880 [Paraliobacillus quinghaiensis]
MDETLKLILDELKVIKQEQEELKKLVSSMKGEVVKDLKPYFDSVEKRIDEKTSELNETFRPTKYY